MGDNVIPVIVDRKWQIAEGYHAVDFERHPDRSFHRLPVVRPSRSVGRTDPDADDAKMLKTFHDGSHRIRAVAHRKLLANPAARLELTTADFSRG